MLDNKWENHKASFRKVTKLTRIWFWGEHLYHRYNLDLPRSTLRGHMDLLANLSLSHMLTGSLWWRQLQLSYASKSVKYLQMNIEGTRHERRRKGKTHHLPVLFLVAWNISLNISPSRWGWVEVLNFQFWRLRTHIYFLLSRPLYCRECLCTGN